LQNYRFQFVRKSSPPPPLFAVHGHHVELFSLGEEASQGLKELSQDGPTAILEAELADKGVKTYVHDGLILPGQTGVMWVTTYGENFGSAAAMLARTNDAFIGARKIPLAMYWGKKQTVLLRVYDSGAEEINESYDYIPAPPCNNPGEEGGTPEGFVHFHPGIFGIADLDVLRDSWGAYAAKMVIERVR